MEWPFFSWIEKHKTKKGNRRIFSVRFYLVHICFPLNWLSCGSTDEWEQSLAITLKNGKRMFEFIIHSLRSVVPHSLLICLFVVLLEQ